MNMQMILFVALGGALGAVGRFGVTSLVGGWAHSIGLGFPLGTLVVNVVGSFVLGVLVELSAQVWTLSPEIRGLLVVGMLGAFTTFSTFSLDVITLFERGQVFSAALYVGLSVVLSVFALYMGLVVIRTFLQS